jgi:hypothetical protein
VVSTGSAATPLLNHRGGSRVPPLRRVAHEYSPDLLHARLTLLYLDADRSSFAGQEAERLIRHFGLIHPMSLSAAVKLACDAGYMEVREVEAVALSLYVKLSQAVDAKHIRRQAA